MKTHLYAVAVVAGAALMLASPARALRIAVPAPTKFKFAVADAVVVGKVTSIADKAEKAELSKGDARDMKIATVKVASAPLGKPGTTVKVGFIEAKAPVGGGIRPPIGRFPAVSLTKDQEALLILVKHPSKKDVYYLANYYDVIAKKDDPNFKKEVEDAKKVAKVLTNPVTALKAKDADDRLFAAAVLITRYKARPAGNIIKTEAVPAEETKLLLNALAEADWDQRAGGPRRDPQMNPQSLFFRLGVTAKDGWERPKDFTHMATEAKKWLKDNAGKFKMTRYVREKLSTQPSEEPE